MEKNKLNQSAGNNSTQVQAGTINNYNITNTTGIDEDKARLICKEEYAIAKQNWTIEANKIAEERVLKLENKLMPKMIQYDNSLKTFSDPSFQVTLRKAQISAASSDKEDDLDMLSELLLHRAENNSNREKKLGITKAIEIVDQIPDSSLIGLSIFYAISKYIPDSHKINNGLGILDELYKIIH